MKYIFCSFLLFLSVLLVKLPVQSVAAGSWQKDIISAPGSDPVNVSCYFPANAKEKNSPVLILLHSWGKSSAEWIKSSAAVKYADANGIILICPDMGKTVFENEFFPETSSRWNQMPGGKWISDVLIPWMRKDKKLGTQRSLTGIAGLEIGARGAMLSAARNPDVFGFAGGISGLYDSASSTRSTVFASAYGKYKDNKDRWESVDSIISIAEKLGNTNLFFSHGERERRPGMDQTEIVIIRIAQLKKKQGGFNYTFYRKPSGGEDWSIWNPCLSQMMQKYSESMQEKKENQ